MSEISDLKQRVEAVGQKFGRLAEQESSYGERLTGLLNAVEEGFARSLRETQALKTELEGAKAEAQKLAGELDAARDETRQRSDELEAAKEETRQRSSELEAAQEDARQRSTELEAAQDEARQRSTELEGARDESKQLRGMLLALLEAVESGGSLDLGETMRNLESRIDRIVSTTDGDLGKAPRAAPREPDAEVPQPVEAEPAEAPNPADAAPIEAIAAEAPPVEAPPVETEPADTPPIASESEGAQDATAEVTIEAAPEVEPAPAAEADPVPDQVSPEKILASLAESEAPSEPADSDSADRAASGDGDEPGDRTAEPPSDDDLSAVNKIIQRISLLTGEFVEPSQRQGDEAEELSVSPLKIGNGSDEAGSRKSKAAPKDESAAKSP